MQSLTVGSILKNSISIGLKNGPSLVGACCLWGLTCWIPYLNVGTTIGLIGIVTKIGGGAVVSPTEIFNPVYRKQMGEFFLVYAFLSVGVMIGMVFLYIPGIVIAIAWSLAPLLVIDKSVNPIEALQQSNNYTYGKKWTIFFGGLVLELAIVVPGAILMTIGGLIHWSLQLLFMAAMMVVLMLAFIGMFGYVYHTLTQGGPAKEA